jgi:glycine cleavage system H protein
MRRVAIEGESEHGRETILVGRPGFKPGGWRHAPAGGFDSLSLPPNGVAMLIRGCLFPDELWYSAEHQVWARVEGDEAVVGITAMGIRLSGEIYMCRPKGVGQVVEQGRAVAVVELAKSIVSVKSPVSGTVVGVNEALAARPELVHTDPYGEGWLARLALAAFEADRAALVSGDAVAPAMEQHAWLHRIEDAP